MSTYRGPCDRCGEYLEKVIRPGRKRYHIECAIAAASDHNRAMAAGIHPQVEASARAGADNAAKIRAGDEKAVARWARGMARYLDSLDTTE